MAAPIPRDAPVMRATFPAKRLSDICEFPVKSVTAADRRPAYRRAGARHPGEIRALDPNLRRPETVREPTEGFHTGEHRMDRSLIEAYVAGPAKLRTAVVGLTHAELTARPG